MVSVAIQTDVSSVVCGEFVVEQREAPPDKQSETEFSFSLNIAHLILLWWTQDATPLNWNQPGQESTFTANKLQILA